MKKIKLLDTTIRDGSYIVSFDYPEVLIGEIITTLDRSGIDYIEVGHGLGIGAYKISEYSSKITDYVHANLANRHLRNSKWGMFCIPGIASLEEVKTMIDMGMSFIRIGTDIDKHETAKSYIELAKKHGLFVCHNFMKSYVLPPHEFAQYAMKSELFGADLVYVVDSAGGMSPTVVESYVESIKKHSKLLIGFHGHDNLSLSVANSLQAAISGATIIDGSMQGIGRGAGNASIEALIAILKKYELSDSEYDLDRITSFSVDFISPLFNRQINLMNLSCGLNEFHSSFTEKLEDVSTITGVSKYSIMREYTKIDKVNFNLDTAVSIANRLKNEEI